jgi:hypothetical protein
MSKIILKTDEMKKIMLQLRKLDYDNWIAVPQDLVQQGLCG